MSEEIQRNFVKYTFYKILPEWKLLSDNIKNDSKKEFIEVLSEFSQDIRVSSYSLVGTRGDVDFMLWKVCKDIESINILMAQLNRTHIGKFLSTAHSYLAMTDRSPYVDEHQHEGQEGTSADMRIIGRPYLFVYPFVKTNEWYQLSLSERQALMTEHFQIGHKYPEIKISTAYSFGLDDQEFVLGFETDNPGAFLELVRDLRESKARPFTLRDTPIFTCLNKPISDCLDDLG